MRPGFVRSIAAKALVASLVVLAPLLAHPGKLDASGGHWAKGKKGYHYHSKKKKVAARPVEDQTRAELFGRWSDGDHDCQSTRDEILVRDNQGKLAYASKGSCKVLSGLWVCPYSGVKLRMATQVAIDHVVPLDHALDCGAAGWTKAQRFTFANDPENLMAVERHVNESKGNKGVVRWKPLEIDFWPEYARRWKAVKLKYGLAITPLEEKHLAKMLQ